MQCECIPLILTDGREVTLTRVRDPRAKRIKLTVNERGARLTLPLRASLSAGAQFVDQHLDWLGAQLDACGGGVVALVRGQTPCLPLRGQCLPVYWQPGRFAQLVQVAGQLCFSLPGAVSHAALTRAVHDFYAAQARMDIAHWLRQYVPTLPRPPARIRLRVLSSQWGSLAPDGSLTLDLALILGPPFAFEYVLVHELCHLIYANHSRAFWAEVETRYPNWRSARDVLKEEGRQLKAQLHALLSPASD